MKQLQWELDEDSTRRWQEKVDHEKRKLANDEWCHKVEREKVESRHKSDLELRDMIQKQEIDTLKVEHEVALADYKRELDNKLRDCQNDLADAKIARDFFKKDKDYYHNKYLT